MPVERRKHDPRGPTARVFFALWPSPEIAEKLATVAAGFAAQAGGKATRRETIHLTLAFLGDVPVERLPELERIAHKIHGRTFSLTLDRFDVWRHNRIFRAGCRVVPTALAALEATLKSDLLEAGFAVADARRAFVPHVTLVRKVAVPDIALPAYESLPWRCERFVLVRSTLATVGSSYQVVAEFRLGGRED